MMNGETMTAKEEILQLIQWAEEARVWALENPKESGGYPYVSGYATATLNRIKEVANKL
jgi:hypothetical protein